MQYSLLPQDFWYLVPFDESCHLCPHPFSLANFSLVFEKQVSSHLSWKSLTEEPDPFKRAQSNSHVLL